MTRRVPFVLASASPRRRRLMAAFPWRTRVEPSGAPEPPPGPGVSPRRYVAGLARRKALAVAARHEAALVLGADTVVYHEGRILGKPSSHAGARAMLASLSGRWHRVYTGLALAARPGSRVWAGVWITRVKMRGLAPGRVKALAVRHMDKAGAYAAQAKGNPFVEKVEGDFDNVVGLPRRGLRELLSRARRAGFRVTL